MERRISVTPDQYYSAQNLTDGGMNAFPPYTPVGMCYVPMQKITTIYEPEVARRQGGACNERNE